MKTQVYRVAGGWQAEDADLFMACFAHSPEAAEEALELGRARARQIAQRWALMTEDDEPLTAEDLEDIAKSEAEIARGDVRRVPAAQ
jgi:hypothetical protein